MGVDKIALRLVIGGDAKGAKDALKSLSKDSGNLGKGLKVMQGGAALGLTAIVGLGTKGVLELKNVTSAISGLQRQSKIGAEDASRLVGQWTRYGVSIEAGSKSFALLSRQIDAANQGSEKSQATFARLGISLDDLKTKSPAEILATVRDRLAEMPPGAERTAIAAGLMGRGFMGLQKWLSASNDDIATLNERLEETGQVMSEEDLKKNKDLLKQQAEIGVELRGIYVQVGQQALPFIREFASGLNSALRVLTPMAPALKYVAAGLAGFLIVSKISSGINAMTGSLRTLTGVARTARSAIAGRIGGGGSVASPAAATATNTDTVAEQRNTQATNLNTGATQRNTTAKTRGIGATDRSAAATQRRTRVDVTGATAAATAGKRVGGLGEKARTSAVPVGGLGASAGGAKGQVKGLGSSAKGATKPVGAMGVSSGKAAAGMIGLGVALAFTLNQLSKLGSAIDQMTEAAGQANTAKSDALANAEKQLARVRKKYGEDSPEYRRMLKVIAEIKAQIEADAYKTPWWAKAAGKAKGAVSWAFGGGQATGGDYLVTKPTLFLAGESGRERATFTPQGKAGPGGTVIHLGGIHIGQLNGTDNAAANRFAEQVADRVMRRLYVAEASGF